MPLSIGDKSYKGCVCVFFQAVFVFTFLSEKELQRILVKSDQEEDFWLYSFISFIFMDHEVNRNSFCVIFLTCTLNMQKVFRQIRQYSA